MREEQRWFLAIGLSLVILFGYQALFMPAVPPPVPVQQSGQDRDKESSEDTRQASASQGDEHSGASSDRQTESEADAENPEAPVPTSVVEHSPVRLKQKSHIVEVKGNRINKWAVIGHARTLGSEKDVVDLCTDVPAPCLEFGFKGAGSPVSVEVSGRDDNRYTATWSVAGGALVAELLLTAESKTMISFFVEGDPAGGRFEPYITMGERLAPDPSLYVFTGLRYRRAGEIESVRGGDLESKHTWDGRFDWVMWDRKYFGRAILPPAVDIKIDLRTEKLPDDEDRGTGSMTVAPATQKLTGDIKRVEFQVFGGAKELDTLRKVGRDLQASIDFGWTAFIARPLLSMVHLFNRLLGNYGWAIVLLTLVIKIVLYPLTRKSYQSMQAMSTLKPKIEALREKYKKDPQRLNQEMMNLYKQEKVNPLGGCLPMLLQIPIFFALYNVLLVSIEIRHAPFMLWIDDLASPEVLALIPLFGFDLPIRILPLIMGASMVVQQKMMPTTVDPAQQKIMMLMPVLFTGMFYNFPSGLVLYWLTNNLVTIAQQWWIQKKAVK